MRMFMFVVIESTKEKYPTGGVVLSRHMITRKGKKSSLYGVGKDGKTLTDVTKVVGLGYADFKDEEDVKTRGEDIAKRKLKEVGLENLIDAKDEYEV